MNALKFYAFIVLIASAHGVYACEFAYVTNIQAGGNGRVTPINLVTDIPDTAIATADSPNAIALNPNQSKMYVTNNGTTTVQVFDTLTNALLGSTPVSSSPEFILITPDGTKGYVSNLGAGEITVFDAITYANIDTVVTGSVDLRGIAVTPDGTKVLVVIDNSVSSIDTTTQVFTPGPAIGSLVVPWAIAITPDSAIAYVTDLGANQVQRINVADGTALGAPIPVGVGPIDIAITPDGAWVYVANEAGSVTRLNTSDQSTVTFGAGTFGNLQDIAINCDGTMAYVTDRINARLWPISIPDNIIGAFIPVPNGAYNLALTCPLLAPASFTGTATCLALPSEYSLTLAWSANQYAAYYNVYESGILIDTVLATDPLIFQTTISSLENPSRFTITAVGAQECESTPRALSTFNVAEACEIEPPTDFIGRIVQNSYLNRTEFVLLTRWTASTASDIASYKIFKDGVLLITIPATQSLTWNLVMSSPAQAEGITIVAVNGDGVESAAVPLRFV